MHKFSCIAVLLAAFSYPAVAFGQSHCPDEDHHTSGESISHLWTGPVNGYYFQVGKAIAAASKHMPDEIRIHYCISKGSESNLAALLDGHADFAIVQGDVAHQFWHCEGEETQHCTNQKDSSRIRLVTPLFVEKAQVLLRPHLYVSSLSELRSPHCVWTGGSGSGSEPTAKVLLEAAGWSREEIAERKSGCHHVPGSLDEALASLRKGEDLDAIIQTRVAPSRPFLEALKDSEIHLLGMDLTAVQRMTEDGIYRQTSIQRSEYPAVRETVYSIGVQALLLTRSNADPDAVRAMAELIEDNQDDIEHHLQRNLLAEGGASGDADSDAAVMVDGQAVGPTRLTLVGSRVSDSLIPYVDPEAKPFLWPWPIRRDAFIRLAILLGALVAIGIFLRMHSGGRRLATGYCREILFVLGGVLLWTFAALWLQATEGDLNEHFTTLSASAFALGENVLAKLPLQLAFAPSPTTQTGSAIVSVFSYLALSLATVYFLPWLKKYWQRLRPGLLGLDAPARTATQRKKQDAAAPQAENTAEKSEAFTRVAGA